MILSTTILSINSHNGNSCSLFIELLDNQSSVLDQSIDLMLDNAIPITVFTSVVRDDPVGTYKARKEGKLRYVLL